MKAQRVSCHGNPICISYCILIPFSSTPFLPPLSQEYKEMAEQSSRLMSELEHEKAKLEEDIKRLNKNKVNRQTDRGRPAKWLF